MIVPESWRIPKIIRILKPGKNAAEVTSYRPITLTSVLGKIFKRIILAMLLRFYLENNFFFPFHAGFLLYKGCDSLSAALLNEVLTARALKKFVYGISLDIKAAYDNVWHDGLMLKLLQSEARGKTSGSLFSYKTPKLLFYGELYLLQSSSTKGASLKEVSFPLFFSQFS
ncbi:hypothetical protein AVEN_104886-1 [Araneus ventricosus]|uniref:Reverse transcriptase domain-containing protein n=1 Tax=Araneus ventricosus TaxID=182803 RepID=A0A4Y2FH05_ARAVE|nr:hypothetical protein AVEN_104886-1 [Araneus ventricosus]